MEKIKNLCIVQARLGSSRLPGKVLMKVGGTTLLEYEINRLRLAKKIDKIVVATTIKKADDKIETLCAKTGIDCFRGSEKDVLDRFYKCSLKYPKYKNIIRATGDCPLIDPKIVDETIVYFEKHKFDYVSNSAPGQETFPDGLDIEIFTKEALYLAARKANLASEREHVTLYFEKNKTIKMGGFKEKNDYSRYRLTVDNQEDFEVVKFLIEHSRPADGFKRFISLLDEHPDVMKKNSQIKRNEGLAISLKKDFKINNL